MHLPHIFVRQQAFDVPFVNDQQTLRFVGLSGRSSASDVTADNLLGSAPVRKAQAAKKEGRRFGVPLSKRRPIFILRRSTKLPLTKTTPKSESCYRQRDRIPGLTPGPRDSLSSPEAPACSPKQTRVSIWQYD